MTWISPNFQDIDFPSGLSLDQKIEIFADRVKGWQLGIAQQCADNIAHSGFAVLSIIVSYFEMIAKFRDGCIKKTDSERYFKDGVYWVFPPLRNYDPQTADALLGKLYDEVRCSLYHGGTTGRNIVLTSETPTNAPIELSMDLTTMFINPHKLIPLLQNHFRMYLSQLRDHNEQDLRSKFAARFDHGV